MIRVMIVDDERLAREELCRLVAGDKEFEVVAMASHGKEAIQKIEEGPVDLIFLDIEMPEMTGLELASHLAHREVPPRIVFVTAYNQYAIEAFTLNAIDYLLKPYQPDRFKKTLERVKQVLQTKEVFREKLIALEDTLIQKGVLKKIVGHRRNSKERIVLDLGEIYYFYARLAEVFACSENGEFIVRGTLKELCQNLDPSQYAQTHKAYLVNLGKIEKVSPMFSGNFEITLKDGKRTKIPLSRRYAQRIKSFLVNW